MQPSSSLPKILEIEVALNSSGTGYGAGFCDEPLMRYQQHLLRDRTTAVGARSGQCRHWPLRAPFALRGDGRSLREEARAGARVRPQGGIIAA